MKNRVLALCLSVVALALACLTLPGEELASPTPPPSDTSTAPPSSTATQATPTLGIPGWLTYTHAACGFELQYPPDGALTVVDADHARLDLAIAPGTNLSEKYAQIDVEAAAGPCLSPLAAGYDPAALNTSTVTVNGVSYLRQDASDAGAGNIWEWEAYSASADCGCVSLSFVLHSINPMDYPTPPPVFDPVAESAVFGDVLSTFTWGP